MFTFSLKGAALTVIASAAMTPALGQHVQVTFDLPGANGGPTSLMDTYLFFAVDPGTTTPIVSFSEGTVSNGQTVTVTNPSTTPGLYEYIAMGLYADSQGTTHAVLATSNDLTGGNWDAMFGVDNTKFDEANIIRSLQTNNQESAILASVIVSGFSSNASPIEGDTGTPASGHLTGFSTGASIGSTSSNAFATPEPSPLLALGVAPIMLFRRPRRS